jgi:hypothetical protein
MSKPALRGRREAYCYCTTLPSRETSVVLD